MRSYLMEINGLVGWALALLKKIPSGTIGTIVIAGSVALSSLVMNGELGEMSGGLSKMSGELGKMSGKLDKMGGKLDKIAENTSVLPDIKSRLEEVHYLTINLPNAIARRDMLTLIDELDSENSSAEEKQQAQRKLNNAIKRFLQNPD